MLNDVMSLLVALYALKLSKRSDTTKDPRYSYGWQRAEVLGALINGVFLLALCFSIFMEAIERFVNISEVSNPKIVIIVGSLGLASNIVGLFLFHDHGHSHGGGGHSHSHGGHSHGSVTPTAASTPASVPALTASTASSEATAAEPAQSVPISKANRPESPSARKRDESVGSLYGHPAQTRAFVVQAAHDMGFESVRSGSGAIRISGGERDALLDEDHVHTSDHAHTHAHHVHDHDVEAAAEPRAKSGGMFARLRGKGNKSADQADAGHSHDGHSHAHGAEASHGHSHGGGQDGSMNMQGVFLHVLGDALGNVGVIASGVFILLSTASWRFYSDPAISFLITIIIFHSALPLVKSASFILLQGVPPTVPLETVKESMLQVDGVLSIHELHIWQLSESKIVASVHVLVDCGSGQMDRYEEIAAKVRRVLHSWGIHSSTIQPEFVKGGIREAARMSGITVAENARDAQGRLITENGELVEDQVVSCPASPAVLLLALTPLA